MERMLAASADVTMLSGHCTVLSHAAVNLSICQILSVNLIDRWVVDCMIVYRIMC